MKKLSALSPCDNKITDVFGFSEVLIKISFKQSNVISEIELEKAHSSTEKRIYAT